MRYGGTRIPLYISKEYMSVTLLLNLRAPQFYPDYPCRGKTRQSALDLAAHRLGQDEAYFTVREILAEASTAADGVLWREPTDFSRCGFATLEFS